MEPNVETALFRVAQEAINNIARHSKAKHVELRFEYREEHVGVVIANDGRGFDPSAGINPVDGKLGLGLVSMEERMNAVAGKFHLRAAPGAGTTITLVAPLEGGSHVGDSGPGRG
ncbi:MAG: ATP-binding protein [Chloroflexi bacterium]|nr:ATP-binding protein [Chloroflexota bacterium]